MKDSEYVNNYEYGSKWEYESTFMVKEYPGYAIHIWSRFLIDIASHPSEQVNADIGFTKDFKNRTGPYASNTFEVIDVNQYLTDLKTYVFSPDFSFEETDGALGLIISFLEFAKSCDFTVIARLK